MYDIAVYLAILLLCSNIGKWRDGLLCGSQGSVADELIFKFDSFAKFTPSLSLYGLCITLVFKGYSGVFIM